MPLPPHVLLGTSTPPRRSLLRWLRRHDVPRGSTTVAPPAEPLPPPATATDTHTRAFWAGPGAGPNTSPRVARLVDDHDRGRRGGSGRPRGNPAFSEALFVELMRAHQYRRAFAQLSEECQLSWGSPEAFAAAQGSSAMRRLAGVKVKAVRFLPEWTEPTLGTAYSDVAELDVEYTISERDRSATVPRTVHLVPGGGRWRSICYPL